MVELDQISNTSPRPLTVDSIDFIDQTIEYMPPVPEARVSCTITVTPRIEFRLSNEQWYREEECQVETGAGGECGATSVMVAFVAKNSTKPSLKLLVDKIQVLDFVVRDCLHW